MDTIPYFEDGDELTCTATTAVLAKRFVKISGDLQDDGTFSVAPAGVGDKVLGVAMWDAAVGQRVTVHTIDSHHMVPITASGALAANDSVAAGAAGVAVKVAPAAGATGAAVGIVMTSAADGTDAMVAMTRHSVTTPA